MEFGTDGVAKKYLFNSFVFETDGKFLLRFRNNEFSSTVGEGEAKSWRKLGERAAVKFGKTLGAKVVSLVSREGEGSGITPVV